ncbi:MAG: glycosyltransferase family 4 protein [Acidobacteria bacterium]|nr:glycosyltransferase family 4 protein [Acidobacteriota bacterium]
MRIALDAIPLVANKTGVGHYTDALAEWLARTHHDHQYELVSPFDFHFPNGHQPPANLHKRFTPVHPLLRKWWLVGLPALLRLSPFDLFHGTNYCIPMFAPCPTVVTIHDLSLYAQTKTHEAKNVSRGKRRIPIMARRADMIIAPSDATKREVEHYLGIPSERIRVVYEAARPKMKPLPPEACEPVLQKYGIDRPYLLYTGTIEPRKNLLKLIRAYSEIIHTTEHRPLLVLCGGRGWLDEEIFELVAELKLQRMVKFTGYVPDEDLPALYSACEIFVYPSLYEGFGLPPLEAMACGAAVVTSNTSSLPEVVGDAGVMVNPHEALELAQVLANLLNDRQQRENFRRAGLERSKIFSWERAAHETQAVYDQVFQDWIKKKAKK